MDTDPMIESEHGRGKDFDANGTNFREGVRGWMGCLRTATGRARTDRRPALEEIWPN